MSGNFECIIYEKTEAISVVKLNRPNVLNAMNRKMWLDLDEALEDSLKDNKIKVLIITGIGRAFSSGADLKESKTRSLTEYRKYLEKLQAISRKIIFFEKPTIAAINGYALGSGYELALACDIRLAAEDAVIGSPEVKVNSSITGGTTRLIQNLIGSGRAKELLFTGDNISGKEAEKIGLVNKAVTPDKLLDYALKMAVKIAENSTNSIKMIKNGLHMAYTNVSIKELMDYEIEACLKCVSTKEREESLKAFFLK